MDSEALATFLAVHREGGVSAAAVVLARTQSAISRRLTLLEQQVGAPLFERIGRGLVLSAVGAALLPHAERVAAVLGDAKAAAAAASRGEVGALHLVVVGTLANAALAGILRRVREQFPAVDLRLHTATSAEVSAQVRSGAAAIGLRYFDDRARDLDARVVHHERLVVACAPTHPRAGRRVTSLAALAGERWIGFPVLGARGEVFATTVRAQFLARGIEVVDTVDIDSLTAQKRLVEAGFGLALIQEGAIEDERRRGDLAVIRVADLDARIPVARLVRRGAHQGRAAQALMALIDARRKDG